jgi:subtilisin family serine protease
LILLGCVLYAAQLAAAEGRLRRYALVLEDAPLAEVAVSREALSNASVRRHRARIGSAQAVVRRDLESRRVRITGAADTLVNAVFVATRAEDAGKLQGIPGVAYVRELLPMRRNLNRAADLVKAPAAWDALGGKTNAGAGVKIAIVDSGIDHTHAAFQDSALQAPAGFPKCAGDDCAYTNSKIIAARSYV